MHFPFIVSEWLADWLSGQIGQRVASVQMNVTHSSQHNQYNQMRYMKYIWWCYFDFGHILCAYLGWLFKEKKNSLFFCKTLNFALQICEVWLGGFSGRFNPSLLETRGGLVASYTFQPDDIDDKMSSRAPSISTGISHISRQYAWSILQRWILISSDQSGSSKSLKNFEMFRYRMNPSEMLVFQTLR